MTPTSKAAKFFNDPGATGKPNERLAADLAERRGRLTTEEVNRDANRRRVMSQPVTRPSVSIGQAMSRGRATYAGCRGCTYLAPTGNCLGVAATPRSCRDGEPPFCHSTGRPGMSIAGNNAELMELTCGACAERPSCPGQAVRIGTENVTAFPPCLKIAAGPTQSRYANPAEPEKE
jgi:hypothetical protein